MVHVDLYKILTSGDHMVVPRAWPPYPSPKPARTCVITGCQRLAYKYRPMEEENLARLVFICPALSFVVNPALAFYPGGILDA